MKKHLFALFLLLALVFQLTACTGNRTGEKESTTAPFNDTVIEYSFNLKVAYPEAFEAGEKRQAENFVASISSAYNVSLMPISASVAGNAYLLFDIDRSLTHPMDYAVIRGEESITLRGGCGASLSNAWQYFFSNLSEADGKLFYDAGEDFVYRYAEHHKTPYGLVGFEYLNDTPGSAAGYAVIYPEFTDDYSLYWANDKGVLKGYTPIHQEALTEKNLYEIEINPFIAIPKQALAICLMQGKAAQASAAGLWIPTQKLPNKNAPLYSFGTLSDPHMGDRYGSTALPYNRLVSALNILSERGAELVGICGDISYDNEYYEYQLYAEALANFHAVSPSIPVYTVAGNHEAKYTGFSRDWFVRFCNDTGGTDSKYRPSQYADNGLDFVIELPDGALMIYLNQMYYDYTSTSSRLLDDSQMTWFENILKASQDKTVFLYFHTFLDEEVGDASNLAGTEYSLPMVMGSKEDIFFRRILSTYKNIVWFSGHSHWEFEMQNREAAAGKTNTNKNIDDKNGTYATMVHVPSVAAPRTVSDYATSLANATDKS